jgi:flagellar FliL protein
VAKKDDAADDDKKKGGGKKKLILMVVGLLVIGFAAKSILLKPKPPTAEEVAAAEEAKHEALAALCAAHNGLPDPTAKGEGEAEGNVEHEADGAAEAPVLELDSITLNLADAHFLKVGLALQLEPGTLIEEVKDNGVGARATNLVIDRLSGKKMSELIPTEARVHVRQELGNDTCMAYEGHVLTIYFTDFVMQ